MDQRKSQSESKRTREIKSEPKWTRERAGVRVKESKRQQETARVDQRDSQSESERARYFFLPWDTSI